MVFSLLKSRTKKSEKEPAETPTQPPATSSSEIPQLSRRQQAERNATKALEELASLLQTDTNASPLAEEINRTTSHTDSLQDIDVNARTVEAAIAQLSNQFTNDEQLQGNVKALAKKWYKVSVTFVESGLMLAKVSVLVYDLNDRIISRVRTL